MTNPERTAAITGAGGYLGGIIRRSLTASGWRSISLVRSPVQGNSEARRFDLAAPCEVRLLADVDVLIHCAYDLTLTAESKIREVNVEGTRRLLPRRARCRCSSRDRAVEHVRL